MLHSRSITTQNFSKKHLYAALLLWFLINLIQALFTEVNNDEAYYAYWAEHLAAGYFDHPPMVALIIRLSTLFFDGNLGLRFFTLILQPLSLLLIWEMTDANSLSYFKKLSVFFITASGMIMMSAYGFFTTPDVPLLFFTSLFLLAYKKFLQQESLAHILWLAVAMGGMVNSKYQGVIVIFFLVLSNLRLLLNTRFLLASFLAFMMGIPHFIWQWNNHFPSFQYHLVRRSNAFEWIYFLEYIPNQLVTFGPFVFAGMLWLLFRHRASGLFERSLMFIMTGMILFFWLITFRGHAEPHWTVAASVPALVLIVNYSALNERFYDYIRKFVGASLILILLARILLMTDLLPSKLELCGKRERIEFIEKIAQGSPVVFTGSFQAASLYHFFTGKPTSSIGNLFSRQTQFDIWRNDRQFSGKRVFLVCDWGHLTKEYKFNNGVVKGFFIDSFQTARDLLITYKNNKYEYFSGERLRWPIEIANQGSSPVSFRHPELSLNIAAVISDGKDLTVIPGKCSPDVSLLKPGDRKIVYFDFQIPLLKTGAYSIGLGCDGFMGPSLNSRLVKIRVRANKEED